jgi:hypothetical protein
MKEKEMGGAYNTSLYWRCEKQALIFVTKPQDKTQIWSLRLTQKDNIKMDLNEIKCKVVDRSHMALDRVCCRAHMKTAMNFQVL